MTVASLYKAARFQNPETWEVSFKKMPEGREFRAEAAAAVAAEKVAIEKLQDSLNRCLFGGNAHLANRTNRNPFQTRLGRTRTKRLFDLVGESRMKLHIVEKLLAGEALGL